MNINRRMFQVLQLLIERRGEIVTKDEFFAEVWKGSFVEDNNLTVAIRGLRRALGDNAKESKYIENIPRKGYRFIFPVETPFEQPAADVSARKEPVREQSVVKRRLVAGLASLGLIVVVFAVAGVAWYRSARPTKPGLDSIAILPFKSTSPQGEYIADGLTDGIINDLSILSRLRVIDRNSGSRYKDQVLDPVAAGLELNVAAVVSGQVEQNEDVIIIGVELIDVATGSSIWRSQFRRRVVDVFATQREISTAIVNNLRAEPTEQERTRLAKAQTNDPVAYDLYLKGRYYWNKRTDPDLWRSIELFRQALDRDPTFAKAYVGLAEAYTLGAFADRGMTVEEKNSMVREAVRRALEIDDSLGEAYAARGINKCYYEWDFAGAESDYKRALALNPSYATAHHWYAEFLSMQGRFEESRAEYQRAASLDPLSLPIEVDHAFSYYYSYDFDTAIDLLTRINLRSPEYKRTYDFLALVYQENQMFAEATDATDRIFDEQLKIGETDGPQFDRRKKFAADLRAAAREKGAQGYWEVMLNSEFGGRGHPYLAAVANTKLGRSDEAFANLEKAFIARDSGMVWLRVTPEFDSLRSDPRYNDLIRRVGFPTQ